MASSGGSWKKVTRGKMKGNSIFVKAGETTTDAKRRFKANYTIYR